MTRQATAREPLLELYDAIAQHQLRDAGAEVAAAIAHAVGTPLNVISGRAELIRHDPSNALAQVARIEEQVKKLATGLRQIVDYLAVPEVRATQAPGRASSATGRSGDAPALDASGPAAPDMVDAETVLADVLALSEALARTSGVELEVDDSGLAGAKVERWHALGTLGTLVSSAIRHAAANGGNSNEQSGKPRVRVGGSIGSQGVSFELAVPGLPLIEGWQLEHFQARPVASECAEFHRTMSICAAVVRGHGGRLLAAADPNGAASVVRFSCRNELA